MIARKAKGLIAALVAAALTSAVAPAMGQQDFVPPVLGEPPYEPQLLRLSEILGALHYLRRLCDSDEGNQWRNQMQALIEAEGPSPIRRARIVDRFNRGYRSYRAVYRTCTPAAALAIDRYMDEGEKISRDITARYGK